MATTAPSQRHGEADCSGCATHPSRQRAGFDVAPGHDYQIPNHVAAGTGLLFRRHGVDLNQPEPYTAADWLDIAPSRQ